MKIFLIRHGESMQNTKENYKIGLPDHKVYLTEIDSNREKQEDYPNITKDIIINKTKNGHSLTINDANILNKHQNAFYHKLQSFL